MAYVGISRELKRDIERRVVQFREAENNRLRKELYPVAGMSVPLSGQDWHDRIERIAWGEHAHFRNQLPPEWVPTPREIDVHFMGEDGGTLEAHRYSGHALTMPPPYKSEYVADIAIHLSELGELGEQLTRYHNVVKQNEERYKAVWVNIGTLLERCKSLNEAVELLPDLRLYLDADTKEQLDRKRGRKVDGVEDTRLAGIDTALITSAAVLGNLNAEQDAGDR